MPVRTRQKKYLHESVNDDFVNIINEQTNLYERENEINMQYGAPTYSLSAESSNPIICEPPPPPPISNLQNENTKPQNINDDNDDLKSNISTTGTSPENITTPSSPTNDNSNQITKYSICKNVSWVFKFAITSKLGTIGWSTFKFFGLLMLISSFHWFLVSIYMKWCYDSSIAGIFSNVLMVSSPLCNSINNIQQVLSNHFISFWLNGIIFCGSFIKGLLVL